MNNQFLNPIPRPPDQVYDALPDVVRLHIRCLEELIQKQHDQIRKLEVRVHELEARLAKNSSNSSKPHFLKHVLAVISVLSGCLTQRILEERTRCYH